jgi:parallel beta-helix repeat protein
VKTFGNTVRYNGGNGIEFEISDGAVIADNYVIGNALTGIFTYSALNADIWNNTVVDNARSAMYFWQDTRRLTRNINVHNNVMAYANGLCPLATQDLRKQWYGADFDVHLDNNVYWRSSPTSPGRFSCWANGTAGQKAYTTLSTFTSETGMDRASKLYEGTPIMGSSMAMSSSAQSGTAAVAAALPANVAAATGRTVGEKKLGATSEMIN